MTTSPAHRRSAAQRRRNAQAFAVPTMSALQSGYSLPRAQMARADTAAAGLRRQRCASVCDVRLSDEAPSFGSVWLQVRAAGAPRMFMLRGCGARVGV